MSHVLFKNNNVFDKLNTLECIKTFDILGFNILKVQLKLNLTHFFFNSSVSIFNVEEHKL